MSKTNEVIRALKRYHLNLVERPHEVDKHVEELFNALRTIGTMDQVLTAFDEIAKKGVPEPIVFMTTIIECVRNSSNGIWRSSACSKGQ